MQTKVDETMLVCANITKAKAQAMFKLELKLCQLTEFSVNSWLTFVPGHYFFNSSYTISEK